MKLQVPRNRTAYQQLERPGLAAAATELAGTGSAATPIPSPARGSHFYKYSEFTGERQLWLKELIVEHRLFLPRLSQLNDPADGRPRLARKSEDQLFTFLYNSPFGVLGRNPGMTVEAQVKEAVILDANIRLHGVQTLMRDLAKSLNAELDDWRIYSLSKRYDNFNLWAKYSGSHTGYCLEFANMPPFFSMAMEVSYGESLEMDISNLDHLNGYWFFCKSEEWSNEEEVRVLVSRKSHPILKIDPSWLNRVILGWKMPEEERFQIRAWAKQRSPELKVVEASYDELDQTLVLRG
jgi:hypothetical protein